MIRTVVPAFIDPPGPLAPIEGWIEYRADLQALAHLPGIATDGTECG